MKPLADAYLPEHDGHQIHYLEYGNPEGVPVVVIHGGPGDSIKSKHLTGYNLNKYRIIGFDQRGCGKSLPLGSIEKNTTQDIVADMERLREHLGIDTWFVSGGSWGSTVALVYAETHPDKVRGLLVRSVFLTRARDEDWAFAKKDGVSRLFPDVWDRRQEFMREFGVGTEHATAVLLKTMENHPEKAAAIAAGVMNWEGNLMSAFADTQYIEPGDVDEAAIASVKIFLHYEANNYWLSENQIMAQVDKIAHIPTLIVHGRYDVLCPVEQAYTLSKQLKEVELVILPMSNHRLTADGEIAKRLAIQGFLAKHTK
jgi:proline iminopeptidase